MASAAPIRRLAGVTFDAVAGRYRLANGRFLSTAGLQRILEGQIAATGANMRADAEALQAGRINLAEWQIAMERRVKSLHLLSAAMEHGGFSRLSRADLFWIEGEVRRQYAFLADFARQIKNRKQALDGRFLARVSLYAEAGRSTEREAGRRLARLAGAVEERRILGAADHCKTCVGEARKGWRPLGELKRIGESECRTRCRCSWATRTAEERAA
jgi:hypothetical protein